MIIRLIWHWLTLTLALYLICHLPFLGIMATHTSDLFWAAFVLILVNTFVRPILLLITLPLVLISLGFFILVLNGMMLYWIPHFVPGFHVPSFISAFFGSIGLSVITGLFGAWDRKAKLSYQQGTPLRDNNKVIDI